MSYFAVERNGNYFDHFVITNEKDGAVSFENYLTLTYDEMKIQEDLEDFVLANMEAADAMFSNESDQTIITLIGDDDVFIWSIIMSSGEDNDILYAFVDWKKDGHMYRYEPENNA